MGISTALTGLLPLIGGKVLSPLPTAILILLLASRRGNANGLAYLLGWFLGTIALGMAILVGGVAVVPSKTPGFQWGADLFQLGFGVLFLALAFRSWQRWQGGEPGAVIDTPKWLGKIDQFTVPRSFLLGAGLGAIGAPKNTTLVLEAGLHLIRSDLSLAQQIAVFFLFDLLGSLGLLVPYLVFYLSGRRGRDFLDQLKEWLLAHDSVILLALFSSLGIYFLIRGGMGTLG
ncbi:MAG: GAP family protein [Deltaproteobacteria bacterium]